MKITYLICLFLFVFTTAVFSQKITLSGNVNDAETKEPLIGASIVVRGTTRGAITDLEGNYQLTFDQKGDYDLIVSFVGYTPTELPLSITADMKQDFALESSLSLKEVVVTADIAIDRKTPVAFSNIPIAQIKEELASRDLPMLLNSTPGVYATQTGGGDGDARVTIRGFNQRNIAVMLDGIPVNDMENGQVYWSNWFGLNLVTKTMQVQRGLGASKLSIPSIGGTINILTKGFEAKPSFEFKQEAGAGGMFQTTLGFTTGKLNGNWGVTGAAAWRQNDGWVDGNYSKALFYFLRIDKALGKNHLISFSGFGGPQEHGQRAFTRPIALVNANYARELGVPETVITTLQSGSGLGSGIDKGIKYNEAWGIVDGKVKSVRFNYYHKPQLSLRHSWNISKKTFLSNVAYLSIGNGGGTNLESTRVPLTAEGQPDLEQVIRINGGPFVSSANVIRASVNNHFWYGLLSTLKHEISPTLNVSGGLDLRSYKGDHYRTVHDMLGGRRFIGSRNARIDNGTTPLSVGDRYFYDYSGFVRWAGGFGLLEYNKNNFSAFLNTSTAVSQYKAVDRMYAKVLELNGKRYYTQNVSTVSPANSDAFVRLRVPIINGVMYTVDHPTQTILNYAKKNNLRIDSTAAQNQTIGWLNLPTLTLKTGFSYNFNRQNTVFVNAGYFNKPVPFASAIDDIYSSGTSDRNGNPLTPELGRYLVVNGNENEKITSTEIGYQFRSPLFALNANTYLTLWRNRPVPTILVQEDPSNPDSERVPAAITGMGAKHIGFEVDFAWNVSPRLKIEGLFSLGHWKWDKEALYISPSGDSTKFDPRGVFVGDAAQLQIGNSIRFVPFKNAYISARTTYFGKNYSNFEPNTLRGTNAGRQSWKIPNYWLTDMNAGYSFHKKNEPTIDVRLSVLNIFDRLYISDANNNDTGSQIGTSDFDAKSSAVFFGLGRRWTVSVEFSF